MIFLTLLWVFLGNLSAVSQSYNNQMWIDYNLAVPVSNRFDYGGDAGFRTQTGSPQVNTWYLRPTAVYRFSSVTAVSAGVAHFLSWSEDANNEHELRLQQQMSIRWPDLQLVSFLHRFRVDERWFYTREQATLFDARLRYLLGLETDDIYLGNSKKPIYFKSQWEGFHQLTSAVNSEGRFFNSVRIHGAFGHRISRSIRYEIHYIWQKALVPDLNEVELLYNIIRLRLYHYLNRPQD